MDEILESERLKELREELEKLEPTEQGAEESLRQAYGSDTERIKLILDIKEQIRSEVYKLRVLAGEE